MSHEMVPELATTSRDLERLASRLLSFESRLSELSAFEQGIFRLWGNDGDTQEELRQWYAELSHEQRGPLDELYAGILDGEAGLHTNLLQAMEEWNLESSALQEFRQILYLVYLEANSVGIDYVTLQARLAEEVPANWFYFQFAGRLAGQTGDLALQGNLQRQFQLLTNPYMWHWRMLSILEFLLAGIGFICFVFVGVIEIQQRRGQGVQTFKQRKSPWTFHEGWAVLVRGGALSIVFMALLAVAPNGVSLLEDFGSLLLYLPTVVLAMALLCRPKTPSLLEMFGCNKGWQRLRSSLPIILSVISLGIIGDWLIMLGGDSFNISNHWTEWFFPQLVWGSQAELWKTTVEVVLLAPIFEEIIFRGIVFTTLRAKYRFPVSMIGSAVFFALVHGYGPIGFLAVFWSGLLWAWLYEQSGSVIPGMCAHAISNGLFVYFLVACFR